MMNLVTLAVNVHIGLLFGAIAVAFWLGYMLRATLIKKCKKKLNTLEREMLRDNAKILELEREKAELLRKVGIHH